MLKNWIHTFIYHLKNDKLFTSLNVLGLGIGIAGVIFAILYWNDEQSYNQWNPNTPYIYQGTANISGEADWAYIPAPFEAFIKEMDGVDAYCYTYGWYAEDMFAYNGKKEMLEKVTDAQNTFFDFFPFEFIYGDAKTALDPNSIALEEKLAKRFFGNENPIGKTITYGDLPLVVKGVYKIQGKSSIMPDVVINRIDNQLKDNKDQWGNFNYSLLLKIKNPNDFTKIAKKLNDIHRENAVALWAKEEGISIEEFDKKYGGIAFSLDPFKDARLRSNVRGYPEGKGNYQFLIIIVGLSFLILVLSIVNYINLATAGAIKRAKEVGVRKIVGASRGNIVLQFIFETVIISLFSILLALSIVELSLPYYNEFLDKTLALKGSLFYGQLIGIFFVVILLAGVFPALYVSNFESLKVLKGNFGRSKSGIWLRNAMLVLQFAIASFFIIGSYVVYQQVRYLTEKDLGFNAAQVVTVSYHRQGKESAQVMQQYQTIKQELLKIKGVEGVDTGPFTFGGGGTSSSGFNYNDRFIQGQNIAVDFDMLPMMQIKLKEGRMLSPEYASDTISNMLINETTQRMMGEKDPIGKEIKWNDRKLKIVGVVKDFSLFSPQAEVPPMVFFHLKTIDWMAYNINYIYVKIKPEHMEQTLADIEKFWSAKVDQKYPFTYDFVDKSYARTYTSYIKQRNLFSLLNVVVILIALFGLFALASYSIQRRMKGIAIRKTLGADTATLLKNLSKQYIVFCVVGFLIALFPTYYLLQLWLDNFSYRIDISVFPFIIGFVILLLLTLAIVLTKAYQATQVDVLKYLKYE